MRSKPLWIWNTMCSRLDYRKDLKSTKTGTEFWGYTKKYPFGVVKHCCYLLLTNSISKVSKQRGRDFSLQKKKLTYTKTGVSTQALTRSWIPFTALMITNKEEASWQFSSGHSATIEGPMPRNAFFQGVVPLWIFPAGTEEPLPVQNRLQEHSALRGSNHSRSETV